MRDSLLVQIPLVTVTNALLVPLLQLSAHGNYVYLCENLTNGQQVLSGIISMYVSLSEVAAGLVPGRGWTLRCWE